MSDITVEQLDSFLQEIKNEYAALSKSEKSASDKEASKSPEGSASGSPEASASGSKPEGSLQKDDLAAKPEPEVEAAPEEVAPEAEVAPEEADPAAEGGEMGPDELYEMYCKLDEEQLAMHFMACNKAMYTKMGAPEEEQALPGEAPPMEAAPAAAPAPEAEAPPPQFGKAEKDELEKLNKSLQDKTSDLEKKVEELTETLTKVVNHPSRKAFTGSNFASTVKEDKSNQPLSKSEVLGKLVDKAKNPKLSDADRAKVESYAYKFSVKPVLSEELSKFLSEEVK